MSPKHFASAAVIALAVAPVVRAQTITIDGTRDAAYGTPVAVQTNNTSFSDNTNADGTSSGGSELDAAYGIVQGSNLNLFIAGNLKQGGSFDHYNVFVADGRPGQNTVNIAGSGANLQNMNGSKFSSGFNGTYALDINASTTQVFVSRADMTQGTAPVTFLGSFAPNSTSPTTLGGVNFSLDDHNVAGVVAGAPSAADQTAAANVTTGLEISIPLTQLGSPSGSVKVLISLNGGANSFLSNQFLTALPTVVDHVGAGGTPYGPGGGKFDFSATPNQFFTINVPAGGSIAATWNQASGGSWGTSSNWSGGIPTSATDTATFGPILAANGTVTLDGNRTVGKVTFNNSSASYTIAQGAGSGVLTIKDTGNPLGEDPRITNQAGNHTIGAPVALANGVNVNTFDNATLTVSGNISGTGGINKSGAGVVVLSGSNSFSGNIVSDAGTIDLRNAAAASTGSITLGDPDVDNLPASLAIGSAGLNISNEILTQRDLANNNNLRTIATSVAGNNALTGTITLNGGVVFSAVAGGTLTVTGLIKDGADTHGSAHHDIRIAGAGTVVLSTNTETNTGDVYVDSGTFLLAGSATLSGGSINVFTGGTALISGTLPSTEKIYSQGTIRFRGNNTASPRVVGLSTITIDNGGLMIVDQSATPANPVFVDAGAIEFIGTPSNGQLDLSNNQMRTTNDQNTVRQQLQFANIITSRTDGTLGYRDTGDGHTQIQFALPGDADLNGMVNSADFNTLATNFNQTGKFWIDGDINYDGTVNALDFNAIATNFGQTLLSPALGTLVPEPGSIALVLMSLFAARRRRI